MTIPITVFVADDDPVYLAAMRDLFENANGVQLVGTATNGREDLGGTDAVEDPPAPRSS